MRIKAPALIIAGDLDEATPEPLARVAQCDRR
jgi:hypothetical protein